MRRITIPAVMLLALASYGVAQQPEPEQDAAPGPRPAVQRAALAGATEIKPYNLVITKDAVSKKGIFTVHRVKEKGQVKWYFEIPKDQFNKDFLWVPQIAAGPFEARPLSDARGGQIRGSKIIRWELRENKVLMRAPAFEAVADETDPLAKAVAASNLSAILMAFDVAAFSKDGSPVIEVSKLYGTDVKELGPGKGTPDASRSFIDRVAAYPENIEAEATYTYAASGPSVRPVLSPLPAARAAQGTYVVHYSMVKLPETPMMPRYRDDRVGFFPGTGQINFSKADQKIDQSVYIARWRLEKKDPTAAVSEPIKPIVYYIDPATPKKFIPYLKRAVEDWQSVFEAAGFKNAILAKEAPAPEQDPDWSAEDVRNTVIRWLPSVTQNAMGPHVSDPRSGEILNGNITIYHNILDIARTWYFLQMGPLDPRAQKFPLPDDLMGKLLEYVVKHEVGHTLGLMHNFKASAMYPQDKLRDPKWLHEMGFCPSIMDYARFNYVAQPEDKIAVEDLWPRIGPYDKWAIHWGYSPIPNAKTPDGELALLDSWAREQEAKPYLRFAERGTPNDPDFAIMMETVGDGDSILSAELGIRNLRRVASMLIPATTTSAEKGKPYEQLESTYKQLWGQLGREVKPVARLVGGMNLINRHVGQDGTLYTPIPAARQRAAVKFLLDNAFTSSSIAFLVKPEFVELLGPGTLTYAWKNQADLLTSLVDIKAWSRMQEISMREKNGYSPAEFISDVRKGLFKELEAAGPVKIDSYRLGLQSSYVRYLAKAAFEIPDPLVKSVSFGAMGDLSQQLKTAIPRSADATTRYHLKELQREIAEAMDRKFVPAGWGSRVPSPAAGALAGEPSTPEASPLAVPETCWPENDR